MTGIEYKQTIHTLKGIVDEHAENIEKGWMPFPVNLERLNVVEFDRIGVLLMDLECSPVPADEMEIAK